MKKSFIVTGMLWAAAISLAGCGTLERGADAHRDASPIEHQELALPSAPPTPSVVMKTPNNPDKTTLTIPSVPAKPSVSNGGDALPSREAKEAPKASTAAPEAVPKSRASAATHNDVSSEAKEKAKSKPAVKKERPEKKSLPVQQNRLSKKALTLSQLRQKYATNFKFSGSTAEKKVALTFDDGPDETYTAQVLNVLKAHHVKATFFVLGVRAQQHPELIARMVSEGHIVGNHSYSHANLPKLSEPNFERQVEATQTILKPMLGYEPKLFRPPFGAINEEQVRWASDHQFMIVNWNVDSLDWRGLPGDKVATNIISTTKSGSIILQHCGGGPSQDLSGTVKALPTVIQELKSQGFQFVTVPELLHVPKSK